MTQQHFLNLPFYFAIHSLPLEKSTAKASSPEIAFVVSLKNQLH